MTPKISEASIQKSCLDLLRIKGYFRMKISTVGIYVKARDTYIKNPNVGCADILAFKKGCPNLAAEIKTKYGVQSDEQKRWQTDWERSGGIYAVVRSVDELMKIIK